ncbi:hypothetical protein ID866_12644, partial [Astraeus odoratus]
MHAPALRTTTLPSSAAHAHACTHPAYHHPPICHPMHAPALHTTPPVICPYTCACTLAPCTTTLPSSATHTHVCTHPAYHPPPLSSGA